MRWSKERHDVKRDRISESGKGLWWVHDDFNWVLLMKTRLFREPDCLEHRFWKAGLWFGQCNIPCLAFSALAWNKSFILPTLVHWYSERVCTWPAFPHQTLEWRTGIEGKLYWWRRPFQGFLGTRSVTDLWEWRGAGLLIKVSGSLTFLSNELCPWISLGLNNKFFVILISIDLQIMIQVKIGWMLEKIIN